MRDGTPSCRTRRPRIASGAAAITASGATMRSLRGPRRAQLGEHVAAARDLDQLGNPADAGDQRRVPLLEIDARPAATRRRSGPAAQQVQGLDRLLGQADQPLGREPAHGQGRPGCRSAVMGWPAATACRYPRRHGMAGRGRGAVGAAAWRDRRDPERPDLRARPACRAGQGRDRAARAAAAAAGQPAPAHLEGAADRASGPLHGRADAGCSAAGCSTTRCGSRPWPAPRPCSTRGWPSASRTRGSTPALLTLLEAMLADPRWLETYVRFELVLLQELGFALDLEQLRGHRRHGRPGLRLAAHRPRGQPRPRRASWRRGCCRCRRSSSADVPAMFADVAAGLGCPATSWPSTLFAPADRPLPAARERLTALHRRQPKRPAA